MPKSKKHFKMPSSFVIIFAVLLLLIFMTWIPGMAKQKVGIADIFLLPFKGFVNNANLIVFILSIGAFLNITVKSKALEAGLQRLVRKMKGKEILLIPICMTLFSIGGTTYGMAEETIPFYAIVIPIFLAAGFDTMTGFLIIMLGAGSGTLAATLDPFKIAVAVDASVNSGVTEASNSLGLVWRTISWIIISVCFQAFVITRAIKIRKNPKKSVLYPRRKEFEKKYSFEHEIIPFTKRRKWVMFVFVFTFLFMIFSLIGWSKFHITIFSRFHNLVTSDAPYFSSMFPAFGDWYMVELSALFLASSLIIALINWKGSDNYINDYIVGSKDLLSVGLIIALSGSIGILLKFSGMGEIIIHALTSSLGSINPMLFIVGLFFIFLIVGFLIPSSSALAKAAFPIIAPVAYSIGQVSMPILAYSFASGFINLVSPTSGYFMAILMLTNIKWNEYLKTVWKPLLGIAVVCIILLIIGTQIPSPIA